MKCNLLKKLLKTCLPVALFCAGLFLSGCGWHFSQSCDQNSQRTISIPYVEGDSDGALTSSIVEHLEKEGGFQYVQSGGTLTLKVVILDKKTEDIGFRYDPKRFAKKKVRIIPNESRLVRLAEVSIIDSLTQKKILGPAHILATCDYDHEYYSLNHNVNRFSLGQLSDIDTTSDIVDIPLNRELGKKIAEYIENHLEELPSQNALG